MLIFSYNVVRKPSEKPFHDRHTYPQRTVGCDQRSAIVVVEEYENPAAEIYQQSDKMPGERSNAGRPQCVWNNAPKSYLSNTWPVVPHRKPARDFLRKYWINVTVIVHVSRSLGVARRAIPPSSTCLFWFVWCVSVAWVFTGIWWKCHVSGTSGNLFVCALGFPLSFPFVLMSDVVLREPHMGLGPSTSLSSFQSVWRQKLLLFVAPRETNPPLNFLILCGKSNRND